MIHSSKNWKRETSGLLFVVFALAFLWTEGWAQMTEVNMGIAFVNARVAPLWVAEKEGFFRKNGIDIKLTNILAEPKGHRRCLAAESTCPLLDPSSTISAIAAGAQLVEVMAITTIMPYYLVGAPDVKNVADLKGKRVGSSGLGLSASRLGCWWRSEPWVWIQTGTRSPWLRRVQSPRESPGWPPVQSAGR